MMVAKRGFAVVRDSRPRGPASWLSLAQTNELLRFSSFVNFRMNQDQALRGS
jgi:hypothetical protein